MIPFLLITFSAKSCIVYSNSQISTFIQNIIKKLTFLQGIFKLEVNHTIRRVAI